MKNIYAASFIRNGILGGWLSIENDGVTYKTGKLTVDPQYRNLRMLYGDIGKVDTGRAVCFPVVTFNMTNGNAYKFIVFGRKSFLNMLKEFI